MTIVPSLCSGQQACAIHSVFEFVVRTYRTQPARSGIVKMLPGFRIAPQFQKKTIQNVFFQQGCLYIIYLVTKVICYLLLYTGVSLITTIIAV
jgi:hypothetical protein